MSYIQNIPVDKLAVDGKKNIIFAILTWDHFEGFGCIKRTITHLMRILEI